jgi:miniconductance mechanosensitive channel
MTEKWLSENHEEIEGIRRGEPTSLTNLGAFRSYMSEYLRNHRDIDVMMPVMVRDMPPTEAGMPVEIYCFSKINSWVPFENVQSTVLDYAYAVVGQFGLKLFQIPSGNDLEALRSLTNQNQKI